MAIILSIHALHFGQAMSIGKQRRQSTMFLKNNIILHQVHIFDNGHMSSKRNL
jgi:hypothetical protein